MVRYFQKPLGPIRVSIEQIQSRYNGADRYFQYGMAAALGFFPPWLMFFSDKFLQVPVGGITLAVVIRFLIRPVYRKHLIDRMKSPAGMLLLLLAAYVAIQAIRVGYSAGLEPFRLAGKPVAVSLGVLLAFYVWITPDEPYRALLGAILPWAMALFIVLFSVEALIGNALLILNSKDWLTAYDYFTIRWQPVYDYFILPFGQLNRSLEVYSALLFPAVLLFRGRRAKIVVFVVTVWIIVVALTNIGWAGGRGTAPRHLWHADSESVLIGILLSCLMYFSTLRYPHLMTRILFTGLIGGFLLSPLIFQRLYQFFDYANMDLRLTLDVRLTIWDAAARSVSKSPLFGNGIDSLRYFGILDLEKPWTHPHNMFLQVWLDLGLAGVMIICGLFIAGWKAINQMAVAIRPPVNASIVMLSTLALTTHSLWQTWFLSLVTLVVVLISILFVNTSPTRNENSR